MPLEVPILRGEEMIYMDEQDTLGLEAMSLKTMDTWWLMLTTDQKRAVITHCISWYRSASPSLDSITLKEEEKR